MTRSRALSHPAMPWLLTALALAARLTYALADVHSLIAADIVQDDAFYYLVIARNIIEGRGPSFDGTIASNAFHPLLMAMVLPLVAAGGDDLTFPVNAIGVVLALFGAGSARLLFALVRRWAGCGAAALATALFAVSPYFVVFGSNGLETGVAIFFALASLLVYQRCIRPHSLPGARSVAAFGLVGGLAVLARVDAAILLAALGADWMLRARHTGAATRSLWRALAAAAVAVAIWLPWGLLSHQATGAWLPTSGTASRQIALNYGWTNLRSIWGPEPSQAGTFDPKDVPAAYWADVATKQLAVHLLEQPLLAPLRAGIPFGVWPRLSAYAPYRAMLRAPVVATAAVLALLALGLFALGRRPERRAGETDEGGADLTRPILIYQLAMFAGYTFYAPAHWYFARYLSLPVLLAMAVAISGLRGLSRPQLRSLLGAALLGFQIFQLASHAGRHLHYQQSPAGGFLRSWQAVSPRIPAEARVGAFQAGIYGWFSGRDIINLDGKVNADAQRALATGSLHRYIDRRGIDYVVDWPWVLQSLCLRHMSAEERASLAFRPVWREARPGRAVLFRVERGNRVNGEQP